LLKEEWSSAPVEFTVVTPPRVTLNPVPSPSSNLTPSFSGSVGTAPGDEPQVTVRVYAGAVASGSPAEIINVPTGGKETWSSPPAAALPEGEYTAIAEQKYHDYGEHHLATSESESVSYVLAPGQVPPTASLTWIPTNPFVNEPVSLVSTSLGGSSPIVSYSWDPTGTGNFVAGGAVFTTMFATPGPHVVRLRVTDSRGRTGIARSTIQVAPARRRLMQPFPIVRIAGTVTGRGAKIRLLSVAAPPGALVTVRCRGRGCATKVQSRLVAVTAASERTGMSLLAFSRFERRFPAGTVLRVVITRGNEIGKYTSFVIRRGLLPLRNDACVEAPVARPVALPVACPSA
ncbi:MAG TPA: PKD domain-containing protein, partial [Gemmatimonadales bacterium]|nr:PKD domain-containing protein [Gemmatimonadales bacterium]